MGLLRHGDHDDPIRYQMREKLMSVGDDSWIEDSHGDKVYKVDGKALRIRDTFVLKDRDGREVLRIKEKLVHVRDTMVIEREGLGDATVKKALVGFRPRFHCEGEGLPEMKAHGNIPEHEYEIEADGQTVATVSKKWFRVRDTYGVEIRQGDGVPNIPVPLILAVVVCIDEMTEIG